MATEQYESVAAALSKAELQFNKGEHPLGVV